jgi:hypothetical protein
MGRVLGLELPVLMDYQVSFFGWRIGRWGFAFLPLLPEEGIEGWWEKAGVPWEQGINPDTTLPFF